MFVPTVSLRFSNCVVTLFVELEVCGARSVSERRVVSSRSSRSGAMGSPISAAGCPGGPRAWSLWWEELPKRRASQRRLPAGSPLRGTAETL